MIWQLYENVHNGLIKKSTKLITNQVSIGTIGLLFYYELIDLFYGKR